MVSYIAYTEYGDLEIVFFIVAFYSVCKYIFTVHKITSNYEWLHTFYILIVTVKKKKVFNPQILVILVPRYDRWHRFFFATTWRRSPRICWASPGALWDSPINFHLYMLNIYYNYFFHRYLFYNFMLIS